MIQVVSIRRFCLSFLYNVRVNDCISHSCLIKFLLSLGLMPLFFTFSSCLMLEAAVYIIQNYPEYLKPWPSSSSITADPQQLRIQTNFLLTNIAFCPIRKRGHQIISLFNIYSWKSSFLLFLMPLLFVYIVSYLLD